MNTTDSPPEAAPLPPPPQPPRRLVRSTDERVVAGVARGLAAYLGVDPSLVRIGFVLASFTGGVGLLAYGVAWLLVPEGTPEPAPSGTLPERLRALPAWAQVLGILAAVLVLGGALGLRPLGWGLGLIAIAAVLYLDSERRDERTPATTAGADAGGAVPAATAGAGARGAADGWPSPMPAAAASWDGSPALPPPTASAQPAAQRDRSRLGRVTVAVWLLAIGVAALLDRADALAVSVAAYGALTATVAGAGLLVGARWGRARGLIALGLVGAMLLAAAPLTQLPVYPGVGERSFTPGAVIDLAPRYDLGAGALRLDLSELRLPAGTTTVEAGVSLGELHVVVPAGVDVDVHAEVVLGEVDVLGERRSGTGLDIAVTDDLPAVERRLDLRIDGGVAEVTVTRSLEGPR